MPLTQIERDITKVVVRQFIAHDAPTPRRMLLRNFKAAAPEALQRLVSLSVLKYANNNPEEFLPWSVAFQYCGDVEALRLGKTSVQVVLRALRTLFERDLDEREPKDYTPANIEEEAKKQNAVIEPETIRVGLHLADEFGVFAGTRRNPSQNGVESVRIGDRILTIGDTDRSWDDHVKQRGVRLEQDGPTLLSVDAGPSDTVRKQSNSTIKDYSFSSERPIATLAEDELGRSDFAKGIAKVVGERTGRDSLVIAIYGPWGSGKSSLKNMILDALNEQKAKTLPLEFNPWEWAGQEKVFEGFFGELSSKLGSVDGSKSAAESAKTLRVYAAMLSATASITGSGRSLLIVLLGVLAFFGLVPPIHNPELLITLKVLGVLSLIMATVLASAGKAADKVAAYLSSKAEAIRKSVGEVKRELHVLLGALGQNVLVVVDDIDRLTPNGIRTVFQLVKANADFPNLVYLLLFQREIVERALSGMGEVGEVDGGEFLQKVVQVGFDIPKLSPKKLEESLEIVVSRLVEGSPAGPKFDQTRWAELFVSGILPYFQTLRDVKRFSNTLSFHFDLYRSGSLFNANPVDLVALEVLRQFEATVYEKLHANRALLTGTQRGELGLPFGGEKKGAVEALLANAARPTEVGEILKDVFPPISRAMAQSTGMALSEIPPDAAFRNEWLRDLRPCHPDVFERYFRFSLTEEDLSEGDLAALLAIIGDRGDFVKKLKEINERGLLGAAVLRLRAHSPSVSDDKIVPFITGLFDMERDLFAQRSTGRVATVPTDIQALFLIGSALRQIPFETRGPALGEAIAQTTALYLPMISFESSDEERRQAVDPLVSDQGAKSIKELCIKKVTDGRLKAELLTHPRLRYILQRWSNWVSVAEVSTWFAEVSESDSGLFSLLKAYLERMNEIVGQRPVRVVYRFAFEEFGKYLKPEVVAERVRLLASSETEDKFVYRLFLRAFDRWKASGQVPYPQNDDEWSTLDQL